MFMAPNKNALNGYVYPLITMTPGEIIQLIDSQAENDLGPGAIVFNDYDYEDATIDKALTLCESDTDHSPEFLDWMRACLLAFKRWSVVDRYRLMPVFEVGKIDL